MILLALSATPSVYASELSMTPFGVANAVRIDISFTNSTHVRDMGFTSAPPGEDCGPNIAVSYAGGTLFALGAASPRAAYFNGHLPHFAADLELCTITNHNGGTIALDGVNTDLGLCTSHTGCYSYTCVAVPGEPVTYTIATMTTIHLFTATCL